MKNNIIQAVDALKDEIVSFVKALVGFKTEVPIPRQVGVGEEEKKCQQYIIDKLKSLGMNIDYFDTSPEHRVIVGKLKGISEGRSLILEGHIDVVPSGPVSEWAFDSWGAEIKDGRIYGRGTCDMKGGVAAMIAAIEAIKNCHYSLKGDLIVEITADEEVQGPGARDCLKRGYLADAVLIAEPSNLNILPVEPGIEHLRIEISGKSTHAGARHTAIHAGGQGKGVNAIEKAFKIVSAIQELERHWAVIKKHPLLPPGMNTINPGVIVGGPGGEKEGMLNMFTNPGTVPDYCSLEYNLFYFPQEKEKAIKAEFENFIKAVSATDSWLKEHPPQITWGIRGISMPPVERSLDHPLVKLACESHARLGREAKIAGFEAVSDLAWFAKASIPGILYGPGQIPQAHSTNEYIEIENLIYATKTIALIILGWCNTK